MRACVRVRGGGEGGEGSKVQAYGDVDPVRANEGPVEVLDCIMSLLHGLVPDEPKLPRDACPVGDTTLCLPAFITAFSYH